VRAEPALSWPASPPLWGRGEIKAACSLDPESLPPTRRLSAVERTTSTNTGTPSASFNGLGAAHDRCVEGAPAHAWRLHGGRRTPLVRAGYKSNTGTPSASNNGLGAAHDRCGRRRAGACIAAHAHAWRPAEAAWRPHGGRAADGGRRTAAAADGGGCGQQTATIGGGGRRRRRRTADCDGLEPCITVDASLHVLSLNLTPYWERNCKTVKLQRAPTC
jgi:hypothetical protein